MPQIHEFSAPEGLGLKPGNLGTDATAAAARRVTSLYSEAAEVQKGSGASIGRGVAAFGEAADKVAAHMEISHGSQGFSSLMAAKTKQWEDLSKNADPNDPAVAQRFLEQNLEPDLEKFKSGGFLTEKGQQWAEHHVQSFRAHMYNKTAADMSSLAGQALKENHEKTVNNLSNLVWNDPSRSNLDFALDTLKSSTDGVVDSSPNLRGVDAGKARSGLMLHGSEALVKSAAMSHISKTGPVPDWVNDPKYSPYVKPDEMRIFERQAQAQQKANLYYEKAAAQYEKAQLIEKSHTELSKNWTDNVSFDDNGKATIKPQYFKNIMDIEMRYPGASTERAKAMINWAQSQQREKKEQITTDPAEHSRLYSGLFDVNKPTTDVDILRAAAERKLDAHDTSVMLQLYKATEERPLKGPIYHDTMTAVKGVLGDSPKGHEAYAKFVQTFVPEYIKQMKAGTLPANALDMRDENSLISQSLKPYRLTPAEMMQGRIYKNLGIGMDPGALGPDFGGGLLPGAKTPTLPPTKDRVKDQVYDTASGKMKWTGTGWVRP